MHLTPASSVLDISGMGNCPPNFAMPRRRRGFTLIESALVTVIVGLGVVATLELLANGTSANAESTQLTTAIHLARNIREMSLGLHFYDPQTPDNWGVETGETLATFDDLDDLDGKAFSPPIDARRQVLNSYTNWQQAITVETVDIDKLTLNVPKGSEPSNRITVVISHRGRPIYRTSWLSVDAIPD